LDPAGNERGRNKLAGGNGMAAIFIAVADRITFQATQIRPGNPSVSDKKKRQPLEV
jgi:hypothetical protein